MIRHAESEENRRLGSLKSAARAVARFSWPSSKDVTAAFEWILVHQQIDSDLSDFGKQQVAHMAGVLQESEFVTSSQIQLVAHSPLIRAKETCRGMLGCVAPVPDTDTEAASSSYPSIESVLELDLLSEKTPAEWIPGNSATFYNRLTALEDWIAERPETVIALVGHSQFFKALLKLDYKFGNCDVMQVRFQPPPTSPPPQADSNSAAAVEKKSLKISSKWSNLKEVHLCRLQPTIEPPPDTTTPTARSTSTGNNESSEESS